MENLTIYQKIRVDEIVISESTTKLYEYSDRENEINALVESMYLIGQQEPIILLPTGDKYIIIDGVLRLKAIIRLELNEIDAIISTFDPTDQFSLTDFIIHHHIRKEKTGTEKLNEIRSLLRIDDPNINPLRDKDSRVKIVTALLGSKGWGRNNVYYLENLLRWEKGHNNDLNMSAQVISNEIPIARAKEAMELIETNQFDSTKEEESGIIKEFLKGSFPKERAQSLIKTYELKKTDVPTVIDIHPIKDENFELILGNAENIQLRDDLQIDTIFTSPPYYLLRSYGDDPHELGQEKTPDEYVKRLADILMIGFGKLKDTGSMFINIGETYKGFHCQAIIERLTLELISRGAIFIEKIIWEKPASKPSNNNTKRLMNCYEVILHFVKTKDFYFERFKINNEKSQKLTRGCKENGASTKPFFIPNKYVSPINFLDKSYLTDILKLSMKNDRPKHVSGETRHPATFPTTLPIIPLWISCPKDPSTVVFDPFSGTSSTGVTALKMGFKFVGIELYEKNIESARRILYDTQKEFDEAAIEQESGEVILPDLNELDDAA